MDRTAPASTAPGDAATQPMPSWRTVLRALREAQGVSQEGWAAQLGYGQATIRRWERGTAVPTADAEQALISQCRAKGLLRTYHQAPLAGLSVTAELLHELLAEARLSARTKTTAGESGPSAPPPVAAVSLGAAEKWVPAEPPIRYAQASDGVRIACHVFGKGPVLVEAPLLPFSPLQALTHEPTLRAWYEDNAQSMTLVHFDHRGTGLSDRADADLSLAARVRDLAAVVDHLGLERFALLGAVTGGPTALAYAGTYPARVSHLVLWCPQTRAADLPLPTWFTDLARQDWHAFSEVVYRALYGPGAAMLEPLWREGAAAHHYAAWLRASIDQDVFLRNGPAFVTVDATRALPCITAPTLVMTRREAPFLGLGSARTLAACIAGAQLSVFEGASLTPWIGDGAAVLAAQTAFLHAARPDPRPRHTAPDVLLTSREREVLALLARGRTGREIAAALTISLSTVQRHIAHIYARVGVRGRVEAAAYAFAHGLVAPSAE